MSLLPPQPPRFGPGDVGPKSDRDWMQLYRFFIQLVNFLLNGTSATKTVINGSAGGAYFSQPFQGTSFSKVVIFCDHLTGSITYTFPSPFVELPAIITTNQLSSSVVTGLTLTTVTLTGSTSTGFLFLEGY